MVTDNVSGQWEPTTFPAWRSHREKPNSWRHTCCQSTFWSLYRRCSIGLAIVLAVIRADPKDLRAIVRAVMRLGLPDDDGGKGRRHCPGLSVAWARSRVH